MKRREQRGGTKKCSSKKLPGIEPPTKLNACDPKLLGRGLSNEHGRITLINNNIFILFARTPCWAPQGAPREPVCPPQALENLRKAAKTADESA